MSGVDVSMSCLVAMSMLGIKHSLIVTSKNMGRQAGLSVDRETEMSTPVLIAHHLAGGDVMTVVRAMIVAQRAGIELGFDRAAAIDLGRSRCAAGGQDQRNADRYLLSTPRCAQSEKSLSAVCQEWRGDFGGAEGHGSYQSGSMIGGATEENDYRQVR